MIRFYCRGCGKELWQGYFESLKRGFKQGDTIDDLWQDLWCCDCCIKGIRAKMLMGKNGGKG